VRSASQWLLIPRGCRTKFAPCDGYHRGSSERHRALSFFSEMITLSDARSIFGDLYGPARRKGAVSRGARCAGVVRPFIARGESQPIFARSTGKTTCSCAHFDTALSGLSAGFACQGEKARVRAVRARARRVVHDAPQCGAGGIGRRVAPGHSARGTTSRSAG